MSKKNGARVNPINTVKQSVQPSEARIYEAEIAALEGTTISAVINFAEKSGKTLFGSASSGDEGNKNPENNVQKIAELKNKLADLFKNKESQVQDEESSDSPDRLTAEELNGDLADYVNQLKDSGIPYEVVRKDGMIGIRTTTPSGDQNSMSNILKNMMEKLGSKLPRSSVDNSNLDDNVKSQVRDVIPNMEKGVLDFHDVNTKETTNNFWYGDEHLFKATQEGLSKNSNAELFGAFAAPSINNKDQDVELMKSQVLFAKETAQKGGTALMPIQINGNHWVGGAMTQETTQEGKKEFKFIHNDPFGNPINEVLRMALKSEGVDVIDLQHKQQEDGYNCGPYTADNLSKFAEIIEKNKGNLDLSGDQFKKELRRDGDQIRQEQQNPNLDKLSSPNTPTQAQSTSKGSQTR
jgi:hypothetical protein